MTCYRFICKQIFFLIISASLFAQEHKEDFELPAAEVKVANSRYNAIKLLDSRLDTTNLGIVQTGAFNRKAKVLAKKPLSDQFAGLLNSMIDQSAGQAELLLQIRQLSFAEVTGATSEKGYFYFRANLYANKGGRYQILNTLDTVILLRSMDVTRGLLRNGSKIMMNFISDNLLKDPSDSVAYSYQQVLNIDQVEKRNIKLYTAVDLTDGLYATYNSFMNQTPDQQIRVEGGQINSGGMVSVVDSNGKLKKVQASKAYAIVHQGKPFVLNRYGYYPLEKREDDFFFTGKAQVTASMGTLITASMFFGVIGSLIASDANATFEMKIDHLNGGFIQLKELK